MPKLSRLNVSLKDFGLVFFIHSTKYGLSRGTFKLIIGSVFGAMFTNLSRNTLNKKCLVANEIPNYSSAFSWPLAELQIEVHEASFKENLESVNY